MKIMQINTVPNGSTGNIMFNIHNSLLDNGYESYVVWGRGRKSSCKNEIFMNDKFGVYFHVLYSRLTGKTGFASKKSTKKLIKIIDEINPDIIHIHNLHGYYININLLFNYFAEKNKKVLWTMHDCWPITGHCSHFSYAKCTKWKNKCFNCPLFGEYPKSFVDNSTWNYNMKRKLFNSIPITVVTPCDWLSKIVKDSFFKNNKIYVINNGINTDIFKKRKSTFKENHNINDKKIILGVASVWTSKKGFDDFLKLSSLLDDEYRIVLVGVSDKQMKLLPNNIIGIKRTNNQIELAEIYSSADLFVNMTYEDTYPTVNLESISCGTPVITYNTGGSPDSMKKYGYVTNSNCVNEVYKYIEDYFANERKFNLDKNGISYLDMINNYFKVYTEMEKGDVK